MLGQIERKRDMHKAAGRATIRTGVSVVGNMKAAHKTTNLPPSSGSPDIFDDFGALTALVQKSFCSAVKKAREENDALGIAAPYSKDGKIFYRQPKTSPTPR